MKNRELQQFIQSQIISPICEAMQGEEPGERQLFGVNSVDLYIALLRHDGNGAELSQALRPLYLELLCGKPGDIGWVFDNAMYLEGTPKYWKNQAAYLLRSSLEKEPQVLFLFENVSIKDLAQSIILYNPQGEGPWVNVLFEIIARAVCEGYSCDWSKLLKEVEPEIANAPRDYNRTRLNFYCYLRSIIMIMLHQCPKEEKDKMIMRLYDNWRHISQIYSVMTGLPIGTDHDNMASVINMCTQNKRKVYARLILAAIQHRPDLAKTNDKTRRAIEKLKKVSQEEEQAYDLDDLCKILFSEVAWEKFMPRVERKTMAEIMKTIEELQQAREVLAKQLKETLSIDEIEVELCQMSAGDAWETFRLLCGMFISNPAWISKAPEIKKRIQEKINKPSMGDNNGIVAGGDFNASVNISDEQIKIAVDRMAEHKLLGDKKDGNNN